jgi:hypothetical protein
MFPSDCLHQRQQSQHQPQVVPQQRLGGPPYNVSTTRSAAAQHAGYYAAYLSTADAANDDMVTARQSYVHADVNGRHHAPAQYYHQTEYQADQSPTSGMHQSWISLYPTATGVDPSEQSSATGRDQLRQDWRGGPSRYASGAGTSLYPGESEQLMVMLSPSHHSNHGNLVTTAAGNGASADRSPLGADNPSVVGNYAYPHSVTDLQTLASSPTTLGSNATAEINKYQSQQQQHHRSVSTAATAAVDIHALRDSGGSSSDARSGISASSQQQQHMKSAVRSRLCGAVGDTLRSTHGAMGTGHGWSQSQQVTQQHPAPFDWMKKQTYPAVTPSGKSVS